MSIIRKYKTFIYDILLNIIAIALPIVVTQFLIYPILSKEISNILFGTILTIIALRNSIGLIIGGSLNNVRLLKQDRNLKEDKSGDYNYLLVISQVFNLVVIIFLIIVYRNIFDGVNFILIFLILLLSTARVYGSVFYRINLTYINIVKLSVINTLGLLVGLAIYLFFIKIWSLIFFFSEFFSIIYILNTTPIIKEEIKITSEFKIVLSDYFHLVLSNIIANGMVYLDRFLINPVLGSEKVTIYYVATVISKMISIVVAPLNNVILSYISKYKNIINKSLFVKYFLGIIILSFIEYMCLQVVSPLAIRLLYPHIYSSAKQYIELASIGIIIGIASNLILPLVLSTSDLKWQSKINAIYVSIYLPLAFILTNQLDLIGFCYASIIANLCRFLVLIVVGIKSFDKEYK